MTTPIQIWTCATHHTAFRCGGWAYVREVQGLISGVAGGERNTTARRMALAGLAAALRDLPAVGASAPISIQTTSPDLVALADFLATLGPSSGASDECAVDLDLWAQILTAAAGRRLAVARAALEPGSPIAFAAAWAELGMDKAKLKGRFTATIPKPNLARAGLGGG